jgi:2-amino-4-hydroxy-6-hydroxymethyldihydropteridine diphosphokinase
LDFSGTASGYPGRGVQPGEQKKNCEQALKWLAEDSDNRILQQSSWYLTQPVGLDDPEWFINGVSLWETGLMPRELLETLQQIESRLGRQRTGKWGPRTIDLDILFYDDRVIREVDLVIPHPELEKRRFVLVPLSEIVPDLIHPVLGKRITELRDALETGDQAIMKLAVDRGYPKI